MQAKVEVHVRVRPPLPQLGESGRQCVIPLGSTELAVRGVVSTAATSSAADSCSTQGGRQHHHHLTSSGRSVTPRPGQPKKGAAPFRRTASDVGPTSSAPSAKVNMMEVTDGQGPPAGRPTRDEVFTFDTVFDGSTSQGEVFEESALPLLDAVLLNLGAPGGARHDRRVSYQPAVCIICYGPTGSGKTHTMVGEWPLAPSSSRGMEVEDFSQTGLLPRIVSSILTASKPAALASVSVHALEVYLDQVRDLLADGCGEDDTSKSSSSLVTLKDPLTMEDVCAATTGRAISSMGELKDLHRLVTSLRVTTSNKRNDASSRSHCIFILRLLTSSSPSTCIASHVALVDLAGSERVKQSQVSGVAMQEAQAINLSLSSLCSVVYALNTGAKHVPYRDSRLTRLLKPCFEGSRLVCIVHTAPGEETASEAVATLRFAERLKETCLARQLSSKGGLSAAEEALRSGIIARQEDEAYSLERLQKSCDQLTAELRLANETVGHVIRRVAKLPTELLFNEPMFRKMIEFKVQMREDAELGNTLVRELVEKVTKPLQLQRVALEAALRSFLSSCEEKGKEEEAKLADMRALVDDEVMTSAPLVRKQVRRKALLSEKVRFLQARLHMSLKMEDALREEEAFLGTHDGTEVGDEHHHLHHVPSNSSSSAHLLAKRRDDELLLLQREVKGRAHGNKMLLALHRLLQWRLAAVEAEIVWERQEAVFRQVQKEVEDLDADLIIKQSILPGGGPCEGAGGSSPMTSCEWRRPLVLSNGDYISFTSSS